MADNLEVVGLEFDTRDFERQLRRTERRIDQFEDSINETERASRRAESAFSSQARAVVGLVAAYGGFRVIQQVSGFVFETNREFEVLEQRLISITGSTQEAAAAFDMITSFARTTPFEVQNLVEAFTTLQAAGIEPTTEMMEGVGNFAAAMGRDITDAVEAMVRAGQGGTERLRESFFVPIETQGEELVINFRGVERRVARDSAAVVAAFTEIGQTDFASGMERQMNTLDGALSNLADTASLVAFSMGEEGLNAAFLDAIRSTDQLLASSEGLADIMSNNVAGALRSVTELGKEWALIVNDMAGQSPEVVGTRMSLMNASPEALQDRLDEFRSIRDSSFTASPEGMTRIDMNQLIRFIEGRLEQLEEEGRDGEGRGGGPDEGSGGRLPRAPGAFSAPGIELQDVGELAESSTDALARYSREQAEAAEQSQRMVDSLREQELALSDGEEAALRFSLSVQGITGAHQEAVVEQWRSVEALRAQEEAAESAAREAFAELEAEQEQLKRSADRMAEAFTDAFLRMGEGATDLRETIGDAVDGILSELLRLTVRQAVTEPLQDAFLGALQGGIPDEPDPISEPSNPVEPVNVGDGLVSGGGGKPVVVNMAPSMTINAIDTQTGAEFLQQHKGEIVGVWAEAMQESSVLQQVARGG